MDLLVNFDKIYHKEKTMNQRAVTKVFLDSRYASPNGLFEIPGEALILEPTSRCWLGEFTCVASWDTIDATNDTVTVNEMGINRILYIPHGPHDVDSLQTSLEASLNTNAPPGIGTYTVSRISTGTSGNSYRSFRIRVTTGTFAFPAASNTLKSIVSFPYGEVQAPYQMSYFVDVRRVHNIYINAPGFGNHNTVSPTGTRGVLAKVPVTAGYGSLVHWVTSGSEHDCVLVGSHSVSNIQLRLCDVAGIEMDLKGTSWSCTLIFER